MKICPLCGWSNSEIKDRCSKCGTVLPGEQSNQGNPAPNTQNDVQQPKGQAFIQARSQNCLQKIQELDKLVSKVISCIVWVSVGLCFLVAGGPKYVAAIIEDIPLRYVEGPSTFQCILGVGIIIAGFVGSKKVAENLTDNIRPYRDYCSVESLIVDNYKIYGTTTKGNIQLSYNNIMGVRCRPGAYDSNRFRLDNDILEIQDAGGKIHTFYTFANCRELQTVIQMNLQNRG